MHAHMTKATWLSSAGLHMNSSDISAGMVTGIFMRHTLDTREYTLGNKKNHTISTLISTPDHPVYVKNKKAFIPIDTVPSYDELSNKNIHILCREHRLSHCRIPYHSQELTEVYNIEVHKKHTCFVGNEPILVHNICRLTPQEIYSHITENHPAQAGMIKRKSWSLSEQGIPVYNNFFLSTLILH